MFEPDERCVREDGALCYSRCYEPATGVGRSTRDFPIRLEIPEHARLHTVLHCVLRSWRTGPDGCDFIIDNEWGAVFFKTEDDAFRFKLVWL